MPAAYQADGPDGFAAGDPAPVNGYHAQADPPVNGFYSPADPPVNGHHVVDPVAGFPYTAPPVDAATAWPLNGHHVVVPVAGFPYAAPPVDAATAWPVDGHGVDRAERDAAEWPVNGHAATPPVNGHAAAPPLNGHGTASNGRSTAWPLNGTVYPLNGDHAPWSDEPEVPLNGSTTWPLNGHQAPPLNGHQAPPLNGHQAPPVDGHPAVDGSSPAPLAGWQREPFRPSYPTVLPREVPELRPAGMPPPAPATRPASALGLTAPPASAPITRLAPPSGLATPPASAPATRLGQSSGLATSPTLDPASMVAPPPALTAPATRRASPAEPTAPPAPTRSTAPVGPGPTPSGASAAFALDADDESTQVLRRYVPASETLGREKAERPAGRPATPPHPPRAVVRRRQARRRRLEWPFLIVFALLSAYLIRAYVVQTFYIPSASMHETLIEGDRVLVNKISYKVHDVHRGDVIVFTKPPKLTADEDDLIKRVVALPGETVEGRGGKVYINGAPLTEPYVAPSCSVNTSDFAPLKVPAGDLWVMGDNRCNSADSRFFGVIDEKTVVGRAFVLVWPVGRFSGL